MPTTPNDACPKCQGTGEQPEGWTLTSARANPSAFQEHRLIATYGPNHNMRTLMNVVSPLHFLDNGNEKCVVCSGTGITNEATARRVQSERDKRQEYFIDLIGGTEEITLPQGFSFITIKAYFNDSDSMSDYFAPHRSLSDEYVIGIIKKGPRTERSARAIIDAIPELAALNWTWNRQDYSGGHGTWLQSGAFGEYPYKCYDGRTKAIFWYEVSFNSYTKVGVKSKFFLEKGTVSKPIAVPEKVEGIVVRKNEEKKGIEIVFPSKPGRDVIEYLKANGFRWSNVQNLWWRKYDPNIMAEVANRLECHHGGG